MTFGAGKNIMAFFTYKAMMIAFLIGKENSFVIFFVRELFFESSAKKSFVIVKEIAKNDLRFC